MNLFIKFMMFSVYTNNYYLIFLLKVDSIYMLRCYKIRKFRMSINILNLIMVSIFLLIKKTQLYIFNKVYLSKQKILFINNNKSKKLFIIFLLLIKNYLYNNLKISKLSIFNYILHSSIILYLYSMLWYISRIKKNNYRLVYRYFCFLYQHKNFYVNDSIHFNHISIYENIINPHLIMDSTFIKGLFYKSIKYFNIQLFNIWKVSSGHSITWLIRNINFFLIKWFNNWIIFMFSHLKYNIEIKLYIFSLIHWFYRKQCNFINRYHSNKSFLWKIKHYFGTFNPYRSDFWVFGDQFSCNYLLKLEWLITIT